MLHCVWIHALLRTTNKKSHQFYYSQSLDMNLSLNSSKKCFPRLHQSFNTLFSYGWTITGYIQLLGKCSRWHAKTTDKESAKSVCKHSWHSFPYSPIKSNQCFKKSGAQLTHTVIRSNSFQLANSTKPRKISTTDRDLSESLAAALVQTSVGFFVRVYSHVRSQMSQLPGNKRRYTKLLHSCPTRFTNTTYL